MSIRDREIALACVLCWVGRTRRWAANRFIRILWRQGKWHLFR
jgi:hypothetical protein